VVNTARTSRRSRWGRGVALLDAIVAAMILGIALSAIIGLSGRALRSQQVGEQLAIAARLADEQLALVLARGPDDYAKRFPVSGTCDAPYTAYTWKLDLSGGSGNEPFDAKVTIAWSDSATPRSVEVSTKIAPRPGEIPDRKPAQAVDRNANPVPATP
jgi:Tfp pilus assembly protein PilV